jgi:hypothetical protein
LFKKNTIYLRIGLSRGWQKYPDRCYLQVNGVFTFPDYLDGKTFLDYAPDFGTHSIHETGEPYVIEEEFV